MIHQTLGILAETAETGQQSGWLQLVLMLGIFGGIFYFMFIKPQRNQKRQHEDMVSKLKAGDLVVTAGGIHGIVHNVRKGTVIIKIDEKAKIEMSIGSITRVKTADAAEENKEDNAQ